MKKYDEAYEKQLSEATDGNKFMVLQSLKQKYTKIKIAQAEKDGKTAEPVDEEQTLKDIVDDIKEDLFSDLDPEDIPNSEISDTEFEDGPNPA